MIAPDSQKPRVLLKIGPGTVIQHFQCTLLVKPVTGSPVGRIRMQMPCPWMGDVAIFNSLQLQPIIKTQM